MSVKNFIKVDGTQASTFQIDAAAAGVKLASVAGALEVKDNAGADTTVTASEMLASSNIGLVINSDAASTGADWTFTLSRPAAGMAADTQIVVPPDNGTAGFVLSTDGTGITTWVPSVSGATDVTFSTTLNWNSPSIVPMFLLPANAVIRSEEHTSELQSRQYLVCRLLLE